jgi:hypothetical protein
MNGNASALEKRRRTKASSRASHSRRWRGGRTTGWPRGLNGGGGKMSTRRAKRLYLTERSTAVRSVKIS